MRLRSSTTIARLAAANAERHLDEVRDYRGASLGSPHIERYHATMRHHADAAEDAAHFAELAAITHDATPTTERHARRARAFADRAHKIVAECAAIAVAA